MSTLRWCALVVLAVVVLYPLLWVALGAMRTTGELFSDPFALPRHLDLSNYLSVLEAQGFWRNILNSLWISTATALLTIVLSVGVAYGVARMQWRFSRLALGYLLLGLLVPVYGAAIPLYTMLQPVINAVGPDVALLIPYVAIGLPLATLILTSYFREIPRELEESAMVDGASLPYAIWRIILPVSAPALAVAGVFAFVNAWNELFFGLIFLTYPGQQTLPVALLGYQGTYGTNWPDELAAIMWAVIPTAIVYLVLQRRLMEGVLRGSLVQ